MKRESLITKLVAFMLCVMMVVGCLPVSVFAAENDWEGDIDVVETEPPLGSESNPIDLTSEWVWNEANTEATVTVTVPAGNTIYYLSYNVAGMTMTIGDDDPVVCSGNPRTPYVWSIANDGEAEADYVITIAYPVGSMENPAEAFLGENTATIEAGSQGYYFTYTAWCDCKLDMTITAEADAGWTYVVNNVTAGTYGDTQWSDSDPVVNPATIELAAGDEIQIIVNTYDSEDPYTAPAGTITMNLEQVLGICADCPIILQEQENTVTNEGTVYYGGYFSGTVMTVSGEGDFNVIYNGETIAATDGVVSTAVSSSNPRMPVVFAIEGDGEYSVSFAYPAGSQMNPAVAVLGDNAASIEEGNSQGYYYTYVAPEAGDLEFKFTALTDGVEADISIVNINSYANKNMSDAVDGVVTMPVSAGDELQITVSVAPDVNWNYPAADFTFNMAYEVTLYDFVSSLTVALDNNIALRFIVDPDLNDDGVLELEGDDNVAVFYKIDKTSGEWTEAGRVAQADWESYSKNRFTAAFDIAAKEMTDEVKIVIVNADGVPVSNEYIDSARAYGMRGVNSLFPKAASNAKTAKQLTMFVDFLNYGAAAQTQFIYNTGDLANAQLTADHQAYATESAEPENLRTGHGSSQVSVEDRIELSFLLDQTTVTSDMYVVISYTHHNGTVESVTIQGTDFGTYTNKSGTRWSVLTPNIATPDGNQLITCVVYSADGNEVTRAQDSVNSYMARVLAATSAAQSLKDLATAAVKLTTSSYNYFHA